MRRRLAVRSIVWYCFEFVKLLHFDSVPVHRCKRQASIHTDVWEWEWIKKSIPNCIRLVGQRFIGRWNATVTEQNIWCFFDPTHDFINDTENSIRTCFDDGATASQLLNSPILLSYLCIAFNFITFCFGSPLVCFGIRRLSLSSSDRYTSTINGIVESFRRRAACIDIPVRSCLA